VILVLVIGALALHPYLPKFTVASADPDVADGEGQSEIDDLDDMEEWDDGMPYGNITDTDVDNLMQFARSQGVDLRLAFEGAYKQDANALGHVFEFSLVFTEFDKNARTYAQSIYSSLLNLGETWGERYFDVLSNQSPAVQQRIRDYLYLAALLAPEGRRAEAEKQCREVPYLFPKDYRFGRDNPMFTGLAWSRLSRLDESELP
jgi:hypothetical protein